MRERVVRFGKGASLVGIHSDGTGSGGERPAVILVNSGILHRVGACRLHVTLARKLASLGYQVLRFDFSGIGDSPVRRDDLAFEESATLELREAMDWMTQAGAGDKFVLIGLCSGADMAFETAKSDSRVVGLGLLDLWTYRTARYYWRHYSPKLLQWEVWRKAIGLRLGSKGQSLDSVPPGPGSPIQEDELDLPTYVREFPERRQAEENLKSLVSRSVELCCVFTGGQGDHYNYDGQFRECFKRVAFGDHLREIYRPAADHIFTDLAEQNVLVSAMSDWLITRFSSDSSGLHSREAAG